MATVNKDFRVKAGLVVEGANATVNGDTVVTETASQTLSNKTFNNGITLNDGTGSNSSIYVGGNDLTVYGHNNLYLNTNNADIILQPDGAAKIWSNTILTDGGWAEVSNKDFRGNFQYNPTSGAQPNTGFGNLEYKDTDAGLEGFYITSSRGWTSPQSGGKMFITSYGDMKLESITGNMQFYMDGAMYIGDAVSGNQIVKQSDLSLFITSESDPVFTGSAAYGIDSTDINNWSSAYAWGDHSTAGYLTSFTETDPIFTASAASGITSTDISHWSSAYGWGNHASAGYLTTETDPVFTASAAAGITSTDISHWSSAYGWGNHASAGYLTTAVESISNTDGNITFSASSGTVTANLANDVEIAGGLTVQGDLTVNGDVTTINTATLAVEDNLVVLNTNVTGTPTLDAGIEVERGDYTNAKLYWNETANAWYVATPGDSSGAATTSALALAGNVTLEDAALVSAHGSATSEAPTVYSWAGATYSTAKFTIQMKQGSDIHVLELLAAIAGSSVYVTEYAEIISNTALGETDVTYDGTTAVLTVTPTSGTVVTKIVAQLIEV